MKSRKEIQKQSSFVDVVQKGVKNFTVKYLCWSLFLIRLPHRCFSVKFAKILRASFFYRTLPVVVSGNNIKKQQV